MLPGPNKYGSFQCPCCGYYTFDEPSGGSYALCEVCFWEDDPIQLDTPDSCGANQVSLQEAQQNYAEFGVSEREFTRYIRAPYADELPD
jgi:hypothetical protein